MAHRSGPDAAINRVRLNSNQRQDHQKGNMKSKGFYLLAENTFESCYFVSRFIEELGQSSSFLGVLAAEPRPAEDILQDRERFHSRFGGVTDLSEELEQIWSELYQPLNPASRRMIQGYGLPRFSTSHHENTVFLGSDINALTARNCMSDLLEIDNPCWLVTYLPKLLEPWWIEVAQSRLLNCHSAVLPSARGMHAIEHVAASRDIDAFRNAAGVTIHHIDAGIDTGSIIRAERVADPFRFDSLWELKGHLYRTGIEWYIQTVRDIIGPADTVPAGIIPSADLKGPNYLKKHFTEEKRRQAEAGYLWMKSQLLEARG